MPSPAVRPSPKPGITRQTSADAASASLRQVTGVSLSFNSDNAESLARENTICGAAQREWGATANASARTRAERARRQRARPHAKTRRERRRHRTHQVAAAGAAAIVSDRAGGVRAEPVAAQFAKGIDALHREARQILHCALPQRAPALRQHGRAVRQIPWRPEAKCCAGL